MTELFNQDNSGTQDPVASLVGEGKKFATVEDMARGKLEADAYIEKLTAEIQSKEDTNSKMNELLEAIKSRGAATTPAAQDPTPGSTDGKEHTSTFNPEDIEALVLAKLEEKSANDMRLNNSRSVLDALTKAYGEKAQEVVNSRSRELDMTEAQVNELAATNPKAFSDLFLSTSSNQGSFNFEGTRRAPESKPASTGKGWSHFRELKKKSPSQFHSPRVQKEFNDSVDAMGTEAFFAS